MAKKKKSKKQNPSQKQDQSSRTNQDEPLKAQVDFTSKVNWDAFYTRKDVADESYEWYAGWPELQSLLIENLLCELSELEKPITERMCEKSSEVVKILVPGCGNSKLSEHLYDLGFQNITNVDFSKVAIMDMLRRNMRERPGMKWRIMDMTDLKFPNESFDAVVDKGGLDVLMSSKIRPRLGYLYLSQVKRVLTAGGKFICLTLAESHVLDLIFHKFRFGWKMSLRMICRLPYNINPELQIFLVVVEKDCPASVFDIPSFLGEYSVESYGDQARNFHEALEKERKIRAEIFNNKDVLYSLEDLKLGAKGNISVMVPGRRIKLILGEPGVSCFSYNGVLLDAKKDSEDSLFPYAVFLVPEERSHNCFYSSEVGQWGISENSKAARLLMVLLDTCNSIFSTKDIQLDLYPLVMELAPANYEHTGDIQFVSANSGLKHREIVHQVMSDLTGPMVVEDVIYEGLKDHTDDDVNYRRLIFQRTENLAQSTALISPKGSIRRRKTKQKASSYAEVEINHDYLPSSYHHGVLACIMLISTHFSEAVPHDSTIKTLIIGLGGGVLPMFIRRNLPDFEIEVVELDPLLLDIARKYFGFQEDEQLKVHIGEGIKFVKDRADSQPEAKSSMKFDMIIVDADSPYSSDGLTSPEASFVDECFFLAAREAMPKHGLLFMNLVSRSSCLKKGVYSMVKKEFNHLCRLKIDGDANEVVVGVKTELGLLNEELSQTRHELIASSHWPIKVVDFLNRIEQIS